jgi:predicted nucleic acid-binding protein
VIFVDTSALYALADRGDPRYNRAVRLFQELLQGGEPLLTHNYVLLESMALIQGRIGLRQAIALAEDARNFEVEWVDGPLHAEAVRQLSRAGNRQLSLVDQVSFLVMKRRGAKRAFAFDKDFVRQGFHLLA